MFICHHSVVRTTIAATTAIGCITSIKIPVGQAQVANPASRSSLTRPLNAQPLTLELKPAFASSRASASTQRSKRDSISVGSTLRRVRFEPPEGDAPPETEGGGTRGARHLSAIEDNRTTNRDRPVARSNWEFVPPEANSASLGTPPTLDSPALDRPDFDPARHASDDLDFVPLLPDNRYGYTVTARPTFLAYLPETSAREVFFSLQTQHGQLTYQTHLPVSGEAGIWQFQLPEAAPELTVETDYQWHLAIVTGDRLQPDSPSISGWIRRVPIDRELANLQTTVADIDLAALYGTRGLWYDTVSVLAALHRTKPSSNALAAEWRNLLSQVGLSDLADRPFLQ